jgi:hypothetical protein
MATAIPRCEDERISTSRSGKSPSSSSFLADFTIVEVHGRQWRCEKLHDEDEDGHASVEFEDP